MYTHYFSWEIEDHLVKSYEALIKASREPSVPMHFADVVIAIALRRFTESTFTDRDLRLFAPNAQMWLGPTGWQQIRGHLRKALRVLDALHIIATEELKQNKKCVIPGIVQLKVSGMRPKLKAFPSRAIKATVFRNGHKSSSSSLETLQLLPSPSSPSAPSPRSLASHCSDARGRKRKAEE